MRIRTCTKTCAYLRWYWRCSGKSKTQNSRTSRTRLSRPSLNASVQPSVNFRWRAASNGRRRQRRCRLNDFWSGSGDSRDCVMRYRRRGCGLCRGPKGAARLTQSWRSLTPLLPLQILFRVSKKVISCWGERDIKINPITPQAVPAIYRAHSFCLSCVVVRYKSFGGETSRTAAERMPVCSTVVNQRFHADSEYALP